MPTEPPLQPLLRRLGEEHAQCGRGNCLGSFHRAPNILDVACFRVLSGELDECQGCFGGSASAQVR
jgi:hypothetical protein